MNREHAAKIWPFVKAFGEGKTLTCCNQKAEYPTFDGDPTSYKILPDLITRPLTLRQSLEITRDMWDWLAKNPGKEKHDWPGFEKNGGYVRELGYTKCACCRYAMDTTGKVLVRNACEACPLISLWGDNGGCEKNYSPYYRWKNNKQDTKAAKQIADAARAELERLDQKEEMDVFMKEGTYEPQGEYYRIKPEPKLRPWRPEEVPVGARFRHKGNSAWVMIISNGFSGYGFDNGDNTICYHDETYLFHHCEHSLDHGKTWLPCGVM